VRVSQTQATQRAEQSRLDALRVNHQTLTAALRPPRNARPNVVSTTIDRPGGYVSLGDTPNFSSGSVTYVVDSQGRGLAAKGWAYDTKGGRTSAQVEMTGRGAPFHGLQASHLFPDFAGGSGLDFNLVPLESQINQSQIATVESFVRSEMRAGREVYLEVYARYDGASKIPSEMTYLVYERQGATMKVVRTAMVGGQTVTGTLQ
jgi:hypothetical protein